MKLDVTSEDDWRNAVETAVREYGRLDILVNNAAILRTEGILDTTEQIWDQVMNINATGVFMKDAPKAFTVRTRMLARSNCPRVVARLVCWVEGCTRSCNVACAVFA